MRHCATSIKCDEWWKALANVFKWIEHKLDNVYVDIWQVCQSVGLEHNNFESSLEGVIFEGFIFDNVSNKLPKVKNNAVLLKVISKNELLLS